MALKKLIITVLGLAAVLMPRAHAQFKRSLPYNYWRVGVGLGASNYLGDLDDDLTFKFTRPGGALSLSYKVTPILALRGSLYYGRLTANDYSSPDFARRRRNLNFSSSIQEASLVAVVDFRASSRRSKFRPNFTPYAFGGIALFNANPYMVDRTGQSPTKIKYFKEIDPEPGVIKDGRNISFDPRQANFITPFAIPLGAGVRFKVTKNIDIELETGFRKTFTDYLDGVSGVYDSAKASVLTDLWVDPPTNPTLDISILGTFGGALLTESQVNDLLIQKYGVVHPVYRQVNGIWEDQGTFVNENGIRGDRTQKDWYTFTCVTVSFILDNPRRCPTFR